MRDAAWQARAWGMVVLFRFGRFCPAVLVKCFPDCRNVSVEQYRAATEMNNS